MEFNKERRHPELTHWEDLRLESRIREIISVLKQESGNTDEAELRETAMDKLREESHNTVYPELNTITEA